MYVISKKKKNPPYLNVLYPRNKLYLRGSDPFAPQITFKHRQYSVDQDYTDILTGVSSKILELFIRVVIYAAVWYYMYAYILNNPHVLSSRHSVLNSGIVRIHKFAGRYA